MLELPKPHPVTKFSEIAALGSSLLQCSLGVHGLKLVPVIGFLGILATECSSKLSVRRWTLF